MKCPEKSCNFSFEAATNQDLPTVELASTSVFITSCRTQKEMHYLKKQLFTKIIIDFVAGSVVQSFANNAILSLITPVLRVNNFSSSSPARGASFVINQPRMVAIFAKRRIVMKRKNKRVKSARNADTSAMD